MLSTSCSHSSLIAFWAVTDLTIIGSHFHSFLPLIILGIVQECLAFVIIINNHCKSNRILIFYFLCNWHNYVMFSLYFLFFSRLSDKAHSVVKQSGGVVLEPVP